MMRAPGPGGETGIGGALGGIRNLGQLIELIRPYFAPSSLQQPPLASTDTGNRAVVRPSQTARRPMVGGTLKWTFPVAFNYPPIVQATPEGAPAAGAVVYIVAGSVTKTSVSLQSTNVADVRFVHLTAEGFPN